MLIGKQEKRRLATPLKWLGYLGLATMVIIMAYHGIRVFEQITKDQDVMPGNVDDQSPSFEIIGLIHTDDLDAISFTAFQRRFDLKLTAMKHQIISEGAHILKSDAFEIDRYLNESHVFEHCEFYHGVGPALSAAISHCAHRGFWGKITAEDEIYVIEKVEGDQHRIESVDMSQEVEEWKKFQHHEDSIPGIPSLESFAFEANNVRRAQSEDSTSTSTKAVLDECAKIEMLLIQHPSLQSCYTDKYPDDNPMEKMMEETMAMFLAAAIMFKETVWMKDGVEFICFDLVLSGVLRAQIGDYWKKNDSTIDRGEMLSKVSQFVTENKNKPSWTYDATYSIRAGGAGYATLGGICNDVAAVGDMCGKRLGPEHLFAHELGHNLGFQHDYHAMCGTYGGDLGLLMGFKGQNRFSQCSIDQAYARWQKGEYECLWTTETDDEGVREWNGCCGDGIIQGFEECDDPSDKCCQNCQRVRGCCPDGEVFQCVEVRNDGKDIEVGNYKHPAFLTDEYVGYFGGCFNDNDLNSPTIYTEMDVQKQHSNRGPLILRHVDVVMCCICNEFYTNTGKNCQHSQKYTTGFWSKFTNEELGDGFWVLSTEPVDHSDHLNAVVCLSDVDHPEVLPASCDWRHLMDAIGPFEDKNGAIAGMKKLNLTKGKLTTFSSQKLDDVSLCMAPYDPKACHKCLVWANVPEKISISGMTKYERAKIKNSIDVTIDLNGDYHRMENEHCEYGIPFFVKDYLQIIYDLQEDKWFVSYYNDRVGMSRGRFNTAIGPIFARCDSSDQIVRTHDYQDLLKCTEGMWTVNEQHDDETSFDLEQSMKIVQHGTAHQSMSHWFDCPNGDPVSVTVSTAHSSKRSWVDCPDIPELSNGDPVSVTFDEETTFSLPGDNSELNGRRRLAGDELCDEFMGIMFDGWPNSEAIPDDVDVKCHSVDIAENEAVVKWSMTSSDRAAMESVERIVETEKGKSVSITISGKTVEVTMKSTKRTAEVSQALDGEGESSKGWAAENWWVFLLIGVILIAGLGLLFYLYRVKVAASAPEGKGRVWVKEGDKKAAAKDKEEETGLVKDKKGGKKQKKEEAKAKKETKKKTAAKKETKEKQAEKKTEEKAKAKGGKKSKGKKGAQK